MHWVLFKLSLIKPRAHACTHRITLLSVFSAAATQSQTTTQLGVSGSYDGVTAGANTNFGSSMSQQTSSNQSATIYQVGQSWQGRA